MLAAEQCEDELFAFWHFLEPREFWNFAGLLFWGLVRSRGELNFRFSCPCVFWFSSHYWNSASVFLFPNLDANCMSFVSVFLSISALAPPKSLYFQMEIHTADLNDRRRIKYFAVPLPFTILACLAWVLLYPLIICAIHPELSYTSTLYKTFLALTTIGWVFAVFRKKWKVIASISAVWLGFSAPRRD